MGPTQSDSPHGPTDDLPAEANRFIGRSRELKQLANLLNRARLITPTGAGGAGKSRLAIQVAHRARSSFPCSAPRRTCFVSIWESPDAAASMTAMLQSTTSNPDANEVFRTFMRGYVLTAVSGVSEGD